MSVTETIEKSDVKLSTVNNLSLRPNWSYYLLDSETMIGFPIDNEPSINWKHVDGPLLICRDGSIHWLTLWERFQLWLGYIDIDHLDMKYGTYHKCKNITSK